MNITRMSNINWERSPNIKAICTLSVDGFEIKECRVIAGEIDIYMVAPSRKLPKPYKNKIGDWVEYESVVWFPKDRQKEINELATAFYDVAQPLYKPYDKDRNPVTYAETPPTTTETTAVIPEPAFDDDIPF